jgi:SAM-dependent methyltransferase
VNYKQFYYPESRIGGFTNIDGTIAFYSRVNALLTPASVVVDIGCGRGAYGEDRILYRRDLRILQGKCARVIGIDVDAKAVQNPFLDEFRLIEAGGLPVEDGSTDLCLADNVLEHLADPDRFFAECRRILKPGGLVCIRTPNVISYFGLLSRLVPNRQHVPVLQKAKDRLNEQDVFPTVFLPSCMDTRRSHPISRFLVSSTSWESCTSALLPT